MDRLGRTRRPDIDGEAWESLAIAAAPWDDRFGADEWRRLVPVMMFEQAELASGDKPVVDRKRLSPADVFAFDRDLYLSARLAKALLRAGGTGLRAEWHPHATDNRVAGHAVARVVGAGWTGPFVEEQAAGRLGFSPPPAEPESFNRWPLAPITCDGREWTGHSVCLTSWFGSGKRDSRGLVVRGDVLRAVLAELPDLTCGLQRVALRDASRSLREEPIVLGGDAPEADDAPDLAEVIATLREEEEEFGHSFAAPLRAYEAEWLGEFASFDLPADYVALLRESNGLDAFRLDVSTGSISDTDERSGGLQIWSVGPGGELEARHAEMRELGGYDAWTDEWFPFGETVEGGSVWMLNAEGIVCGAGKEGLHYGPDAPFAQWLFDQVRDLRAAWPAAIEGEEWAQALYACRV